MMSGVDIDELRAELIATGLPADTASRDPIEVVQEWLALARDAGVFNHDALVVASADEDGHPSLRNVLMRDVIDGGFCFYTNYESQKGEELIARPAVEALFSWIVLERQIRIRGRAEVLAPDRSDAYFARRPRASQLAAIASDQSRPIPDREWLLRRYDEVVAAHEGRPVRRPRHWGGFRIVPDRIEFWQGHPNRLHDRLVFERDGAGWVTSRLAP